VPAGYAGAPIKRVTAENAIDDAYRDPGAGEVPLVLIRPDLLRRVVLGVLGPAGRGRNARLGAGHGRLPARTAS